ncbi:DoxX family protein [Nocardia salmonicida]
MFIATAIVSSLLAVGLVLSAVGKLTRDKAQLETMAKVRFPEDKLWMLAVAEIAGAVGLVGGLFWWPLGVAAAIGVVAYFVGALGAHLRAGDRQIAAPAAMFLIAVAALTLRLLTI